MRNGEMIVKAIGVRMLRPSQLDDLEQCCRTGDLRALVGIGFSGLDQLNDEDRTVAVVVNEFGELVGAVSIDDIFAASSRPDSDDESDFFGEQPKFNSWNQITIAFWAQRACVSLAKHLGIDVSGEGITTVAGFIQRQNERLPRLGDSAPMGRFTLTVIEQARRRDLDRCARQCNRQRRTRHDLREPVVSCRVVS